MNSPAEPLQLTGPDGTQVRIFMRTSTKCTRIQMRALPDGVELIRPVLSTRESALFFARENFDWIRKVMRRIATRPVRTEPFPPTALRLGFTDTVFQIRVEESDVCWTGAKVVPENILLLSGCVSNHPQCANAMRGWLMREAERVLFPFAAALALEKGVTVTSYRTGLQKRSWGICTNKGVVTLNAALLFFRPALARYVILHEFTHRYEMNHSPRFWRKLETWCPGAKAFREELNQRSRELPLWLWTDPE